MLILLKFVCLFISVLFGFSNIIKMYYKNDIQGFYIITMSLGIVGFVFLQFKLYL